MTDPEDTESALAGLLTGTMVFLIGTVFPVLFLRAIMQGAAPQLPKDMASGVRDAASLLILAIGSFKLMSFGARMIVRQVSWLRARWRRS